MAYFRPYTTKDFIYGKHPLHDGREMYSTKWKEVNNLEGKSAHSLIVDEFAFDYLEEVKQNLKAKGTEGKIPSVRRKSTEQEQVDLSNLPHGLDEDSIRDCNLAKVPIRIISSNISLPIEFNLAITSKGIVLDAESKEGDLDLEKTLFTFDEFHSLLLEKESRGCSLDNLPDFKKRKDGMVFKAVDKLFQNNMPSIVPNNNYYLKQGDGVVFNRDMKPLSYFKNLGLCWLESMSKLTILVENPLVFTKSNSKDGFIYFRHNQFTFKTSVLFVEKSKNNNFDLYSLAFIKDFIANNFSSSECSVNDDEINKLYDVKTMFYDKIELILSKKKERNQRNSAYVFMKTLEREGVNHVFQL